MPEQQAELFEQVGSRHPGARKEWVPAEPATSSKTSSKPAGGEEARDLSYQALMKSGDLDQLHKEYLSLLRKAYARELPDKRGRRWQGLTDQEAALWMGVDRSTINGRRDELMARNKRAVTEHPVVEKRRMRKCRVTGNTATAWQIVPGLFD